MITSATRTQKITAGVTVAFAAAAITLGGAAVVVANAYQEPAPAPIQLQDHPTPSYFFI